MFQGKHEKRVQERKIYGHKKRKDASQKLMNKQK